MPDSSASSDLCQTWLDVTVAVFSCLLQLEMSFCTDREDAASMGLTAFKQLLETYTVSLTQIGRSALHLMVWSRASSASAATRKQLPLCWHVQADLFDCEKDVHHAFSSYFACMGSSIFHQEGDVPCQSWAAGCMCLIWRKDKAGHSVSCRQLQTAFHSCAQLRCMHQASVSFGYCQMPTGNACAVLWTAENWYSRRHG